MHPHKQPNKNPPTSNSSSEDISWSVVCPTISTPPTSTPCFAASGSQLSPRAIVLECPFEGDSEEIVIASSVEEPLDTDEDVLVDLTQTFDSPVAGQNRSGSSTSPPSVSISDSLSRTSTSLSKVYESGSQTPPESSLLKPVRLQSLRQHLLFSRSISAVSPKVEQSLPIARSQTLFASSPHHSSGTSETVTASTESISINGNTNRSIAFQSRQTNFQHSKTTSSDTSSTTQHQSAITSTQFIGYPQPTPANAWHRPAEGRPGPLNMQHQSSGIPNSLPVQTFYEPSTSDSMQQVARPAYGPVAPPVYGPVAPPCRDYATDMTRVASAAYSKAMNDAARIQMMTAAQFARNPQQPIIIQNTTKAVAESQNESRLSAPPPKRSFIDSWSEFLQDFWKSRLNRLLVVTLTGAGLYLYWEWWQHNRRMQLMQRRIEANPLLRLGQLISGVADGQRTKIPNNTYY